jgi:hypothetical protein
MSLVLTPLAAGVFEDPAFPGNLPAVLRRIAAAGEDSVSIGKLWPGLHFLLSGEEPFPRTQAERLGVEWLDDPLEDALMGGEAAGIDDTYGGARYQTPADVSRIAEALSETSEEDLRESYDPEALVENEIPPAIWLDDPEAIDRLLAAFRALTDFYLRCRSDGSGALIRVL